MIIIALPQRDFDPTEVVVPWQVLRDARHDVRFATPSGDRGHADPRVLDGRGFGPWRPWLKATAQVESAYRELEQDEHFVSPSRFDDLDPGKIDGLILPGGHAPGMRSYLEDPDLQRVVAELFAADRPVGAICHGVLVAARAQAIGASHSVLCGRRTTALPRRMELAAWAGTRLWLGDYFRTYPTPVQEEVSAALSSRDDFIAGPWWPVRDRADAPDRGFAVTDGRYVSARWPGDAHRFARDFGRVLETAREG